MKVTFLGTGGGRFVTSQQVLATGGFVLELDRERLHVDPGPGALVRAKQFGVKLGTLTAVLVSHSHTDHCTDAAAVIEAMTSGTVNKRGVVVGNKTVFEGSPDGVFRAVISAFHKSCAEKTCQLAPGEKVQLGKVAVTATPTKHTEPYAIGFLFEGSKTVGYTSDTECFPELAAAFAGCDLLIVNCPLARGKKYPMYMNAEDAVTLLRQAQPKCAIIQHFGITMWRAGPARQVAWIAKQSGVPAVAATDGLVWTG